MGSKKIIAWLASSASGLPVSSVRIAGTSRRRSTTRAARRSSNARSSAASGGGLEAMEREALPELAEQPLVVGQIMGHDERHAAQVVEQPWARLVRHPDARDLLPRAHDPPAGSPPPAPGPCETYSSGHLT